MAAPAGSAAAIGFLGIGTMGWPMAAQLAKAGYALAVRDLSAERVAAFIAEHSAETAPTNAALAARSDIVITMLPTSREVEAALTAEDGLLAGLRPGALLVDMTSGSPTATQGLAGQVAAAGGHMIDAPVSGGVARARTGDLAIMVGGEAADIARAEPVLRCMGSSVVRAGPVGAAHAMKALNNLMSAAGFLIGAEALLIGRKFGLDPATMVDILNASTGMNNSTQRKFKQMVISRRFDGGFGLDLMVKDLTIALDLAKETATPAPFAALCREMWAAAQAMLGPGREHTELAKLSERLAGAEIVSERSE